MQPEHQHLVVHEGLTDLEQMKLGMFKTVARQGIRVLGFAFFFAGIYWLVRSLL
jgi:hypothetical protein